MRSMRRALLALSAALPLACAAKQHTAPVASVTYEERVSSGISFRIVHIGGSKIEFSLTSNTASIEKEIEARRSIRCAKEAVRNDRPCDIGGKKMICSSCICQEDANAGIAEENGIVIVTCGEMVYRIKN